MTSLETLIVHVLIVHTQTGIDNRMRIYIVYAYIIFVCVCIFIAILVHGRGRSSENLQMRKFFYICRV